MYVVLLDYSAAENEGGYSPKFLCETLEEARKLDFFLSTHVNQWGSKWTHEKMEVYDYPPPPLKDRLLTLWKHFERSRNMAHDSIPSLEQQKEWFQKLFAEELK